MSQVMTDPWVDACSSTDLPVTGGVAAIIDDRQIAIFRVDNKVFATSNFDPVGKANVMSRGIIGSIGEELVITSPLYKQHYSLASGQCVENSDLAIKTYPVREADGRISVKVT